MFYKNSIKKIVSLGSKLNVSNIKNVGAKSVQLLTSPEVILTLKICASIIGVAQAVNELKNSRNSIGFKIK